MKAVIYEKYGAPEVLQLKDIEKPTPKDNEVLVKVHATTVNSGDCRMRSAQTPPGFGLLFRLAVGIFGPRKKILGTEVSGEIEAIGKDVKQFKVGDQVFVFKGMDMGAYVEYLCIQEDGPVMHKPENITLEEAAALSFGGTTAIFFVRDLAQIQSGQKVLVNGASGCVGHFVVQLAKYYGAEVVGICSSSNVDLVKSFGADDVIDYTQEDFTQRSERFDVLIDTVGNLPFSRCKKVLKKQGKLALIAGGLPQFLLMFWRWLVGGIRILAGPASEKKEYLYFLKKLVEEGKLKVFIDRRYPVSQIVEAHRYTDKGHKRGSVVVTLDA